jgi:hypothetical protein
MVIEFKEVEDWVFLKLNYRISEHFADFEFPDFMMVKSMTSKDRQEYKAKRIIDYVTSNYRALFDQESIRIQNAIYEYEGNNSSEKFEKYLVLNYRKLREFSNPKDVDHFLELSKIEIDYQKDNSVKEYMFWNLKSSFQLDFVQILLAFFEKNFSPILHKYNLFPSPAETFMNAVSNFNVRFGLVDPLPDDWKNLLSSGSNSIITLTYNGFDEKNKYKIELKKLYSNFKSYISGLINSKANDYIETYTILKNLQINLDELQRSYQEDDLNSNVEDYDLHPLINKNLITRRDPKLNKFNNWPFSYYNYYNNFLHIQMDITINAYKFIKMQLDLLKELKNIETPNADEQRSKKVNPVQNISEQLSTSKLQWRGNINQLITFFYDASKEVLLKGKPILNADRKQITELITTNFLDKNGNEIKQSVIDTIFTPSKETKRPSKNKRIQIPIND